MKSKENKRRVLQSIGLAGSLWVATVSVPTILEEAKPTINYPIVSWDGIPRIKGWKILTEPLPRYIGFMREPVNLSIYFVN